MANPSTTKAAPPQSAIRITSSMSVFAPAIGWLIPGAGHSDPEALDPRAAAHGLHRHHVRAWVWRCRDASIKPNGGDILDILGFVGDIGAGGLYIVTRAMDLGQGAIAHATADYGTKFMIVAGLLNFISVADAYHIAIGKKP